METSTQDFENYGLKILIFQYYLSMFSARTYGTTTKIQTTSKASKAGNPKEKYIAIQTSLQCHLIN